MKEEKDPTISGIQSEFLKFLDEKFVQILKDIFNDIYNTGNIPMDHEIHWYVECP